MPIHITRFNLIISLSASSLVASENQEGDFWPWYSGFHTPPVAGADLRAASVQRRMEGALPPVDFRAVCLVRAIVERAWRERGGRVEGAWRERGGSVEGASRECGGCVEGASRGEQKMRSE